MSDDSLDLQRLAGNKLKGGKRTNPQEMPEVRRKGAEENHKCRQCDFVSQTESLFNQHLNAAHVGNPTCPF